MAPQPIPVVPPVTAAPPGQPHRPEPAEPQPQEPAPEPGPAVQPELQKVTRQEAAVMMRSYALLMGCDVSYDGQPVLAFADSGEVDSWAWDAMSWAVDAGVMGGKGGVLDPTGIATRAEIAQMMMSLCENVLNG